MKTCDGRHLFRFMVPRAVLDRIASAMPTIVRAAQRALERLQAATCRIDGCVHCHPRTTP